MTKGDFLNNPYRAICMHSEPIAVEWLAAAWSSPDFRDEVIHELTRSISKVGSFNLANDYWLRTLPEFLTKDDVCQLYAAIRDESQRWECEWRALFEEAFPNSAGFLPASQDGKAVREELWNAIESGDGRGVESLVSILPHVTDGLQILSEIGERGKTLVQSARDRGQTLVVEILQKAEKDLNERSSTSRGTE